MRTSQNTFRQIPPATAPQTTSSIGATIEPGSNSPTGRSSPKGRGETSPLAPRNTSRPTSSDDDTRNEGIPLSLSVNHLPQVALSGISNPGVASAAVGAEKSSAESRKRAYKGTLAFNKKANVNTTDVATSSSNSSGPTVSMSRNSSAMAVSNVSGGEQRLAAGFDSLPENMIRDVGSYLPTADINNFGSMRNKAINKAMGPRLSCLKLTGDAKQVETLIDFMQVLGRAETLPTDRPNSIRGLPLSMQVAPLEALALQITSMPSHNGINDMKEANKQFLLQFNAIPVESRTQSLTDLAIVAEQSKTTEFHVGETVQRGANVQHTAIFYGVTDQSVIENLELMAGTSEELNSAGAAMRSGGNVAEIASQFGINSDAGRQALESITATSNAPGTAGAAFAKGGFTKDQIATRFGLSEYGKSKLGQAPSQLPFVLH
jgi:hypothetical protein